MNLRHPIVGAILTLCVGFVSPARGEKLVIQEQEIIFPNDSLTLAATLLLPSVAGKAPGVVIIHGSGDSDRTNPWTRAYAEALAKRGVAVLYPDKRGCGKSEGDWKTASLLDLADDAAAGIQYLRTNEKIDATRIGLIGFSQGGHVLPAAASRDSNACFAIDISGSVVPMAEQMADEVEMSAERAGLPPAQIKILNDLHTKGLRFVATGAGEDWDAYESALAQARQSDLKGSAVLKRFPDSRQHPALAHVRAISGYDPMPWWKKVTVPSLFVFGVADTQLRVQKSIDRLQRELPPEKFNYTILQFSKNGHALYREDLIDFLARWISDKGAW